MMKLLYLAVSLLFLGLSSSFETEILESRASKGYTLEFEYEQQAKMNKRGFNAFPLSVKGTIEFYDDEYFLKEDNVKSIQFDVVYTSNKIADDDYNFNSDLKRDIGTKSRVKILNRYHLTEEELQFKFASSSPISSIKQLDLSRELVGQVYDDYLGNSFGADSTFIFNTKKREVDIQRKASPKSFVEVEQIGLNEISVREAGDILVLPNPIIAAKDSIYYNNNTAFDYIREIIDREAKLPENDEEYIAEILYYSYFTLKSVRKTDTVYSPYGNTKSKFMFDITYKTIGSIDKLVKELRDSPNQTEMSQAILSQLREGEKLPFELRGRIGYSKLEKLTPNKRLSFQHLSLDSNYLDYMKFDLVLTLDGEEYVLYTQGLLKSYVKISFDSEIDLTKELFGQKLIPEERNFEVSGNFIFATNYGSDVMFAPAGPRKHFVVSTYLDRKHAKTVAKSIEYNDVISSMMYVKMFQFEVISIKPVVACTPKKIKTKTTKFGEYQDCLFPQNKKMECYSYKSLFPTGTEPTSCEVQECSSVDSVAFNRKCSKVSGAKNICKIDSAKKQVCVKREACTGSRKGDNCARIYQFLGENKKDTCVVDSLPLASIVAPFNDGSMQFKSNKYCH